MGGREWVVSGCLIIRVGLIDVLLYWIIREEIVKIQGYWKFLILHSSHTSLCWAEVPLGLNISQKVIMSCFGLFSPQGVCDT